MLPTGVAPGGSREENRDAEEEKLTAGISGQGNTRASVQREACMRMKLSTMVFQAHKAQGEVQDGGFWRGSLGIICLHLLCLTAMGSH